LDKQQQTINGFCPPANWMKRHRFLPIFFFASLPWLSLVGCWSAERWNVHSAYSKTAGFLTMKTVVSGVLTTQQRAVFDDGVSLFTATGKKH
jgi:hypothetical protein